MSTTAADANSLAMVAQQGSTLGGLIYGVVNPFIMKAVGDNYTWTALVYGLFIVLGTLGMFSLTRNFDSGSEPVVAAQKKEQVKGGFLKAMTGPTLPFFFAMILNNMHLGFFMTLLAYFTQYVLQDPRHPQHRSHCGLRRRSDRRHGSARSSVIRWARSSAFVYFLHPHPASSIC